MIIKHSWPRRSGKTGAAIMAALQYGCGIYFCGFVPEQIKRRLPDIVASGLRGHNMLIIDHYELATDEEREIIDTLPNVEIFGTFGPDADDYRIPPSEKWLGILRDVESGFITMDFALKEFNIASLSDGVVGG